MKSFLEEYGFVILISIVVVMLVIIASPIGGDIKASVLGLVDSFGSKTVAKIDKANFQGSNYRIEYYLDGGINDPSNPVTYVKDSGDIVLADPSKEDYTFDGWYTEPEFTNKVTSIVNGTEGDVNLYAKFTKNKTYKLKAGLAFNNLIPATTKSIVFTDETMPASATLIDVDLDGDGGIVAWLDGTTFKVSTQRSGQKVIFNEDSSRMFDGVSNPAAKNLVSINFENVDTSKVTNMLKMFYYAGGNATTFNLDLSNWDTSNVTNMSYMFACAGVNATTFSIEGLSGWDTSNITDMSYMFYSAGYIATIFNLDLSAWNTSKVANMLNMFRDAGFNATTFNLDLSDWNTSNVTNMSYMLNYAGWKATTWDIGDLSDWDTSNVTNMSYMFHYAGWKATTFNLDLSDWDTSKVTNMSYMFHCAGCNAISWSIGNISGWDTSKVTDMTCMLYYAGRDATHSLNLSGWNVNEVTSYTNFNYGVTGKITAPTWVN